MALTEADRRRFAAQARDLAALECDDEPDVDALDRAVARADADRRRAGASPLHRDDDPPELELYRRARALGLRRLRR